MFPVRGWVKFCSPGRPVIFFFCQIRVTKCSYIPQSRFRCISLRHRSLPVKLPLKNSFLRISKTLLNVSSTLTFMILFFITVTRVAQFDSSIIVCTENDTALFAVAILQKFLELSGVFVLFLFLTFGGKKEQITDR